MNRKFIGLSVLLICQIIAIWASVEANRLSTQSRQSAVACQYGEIYCYVTLYKQFMCLHNMQKCDGEQDCSLGEDEEIGTCGYSICNRRLDGPFGWFASPGFPYPVPRNVHCSWVIHQQAASSALSVQLRIVSATLDQSVVYVYDGPDNTYALLAKLTGYNMVGQVIESTSSWMNIQFDTDTDMHFNSFNFTYQIKGYCLPAQNKCVNEYECYMTYDRCNGVWNCPLTGSDELTCHNCIAGEYTCGLATNQCYHPSERCDGIARCSNSIDETNCSSSQCGSHNGTFLCDNGRCIYEQWTCDQRDDCGDNSDERSCAGTTKRVIIAAICGSMICALLLIILLGCSCKLYSLRNIERNGGHHHETPMSRLYAELIRRRAPPPYHEAMITSRNFDEVQHEYLEQMRNASGRSRRSHRGSRTSLRNHANCNDTDNVNTDSNGICRIPIGDIESSVENLSGTTLCTITEELENPNNTNIERHSSMAELLPSDSDNSSSDYDNDNDRRTNHNSATHMVGHPGNDVDDDDMNILACASLSARWSRNTDTDDSSDEECILDGQTDPYFHSHSAPNDHDICEGRCDSVSIDTEVSTSIASIDHQDVVSGGDIGVKNSAGQNESASSENNSINSTTHSDSSHGDTKMSETIDSCFMRSDSHESLNSIG